MKNHVFSRRQFIQTAALAGTALLSPWAVSDSRAAAQAVKRTATDQVALGKTGLKLSRLGFGTGSNNGQALMDLGQDNFTKLVHYAYDHGITYFDYLGHFFGRLINDGLSRMHYEVDTSVLTAIQNWLDGK